MLLNGTVLTMRDSDGSAPSGAAEAVLAPVGIRSHSARSSCTSTMTASRHPTEAGSKTSQACTSRVVVAVVSAMVAVEDADDGGEEDGGSGTPAAVTGVPGSFVGKEDEDEDEDEDEAMTVEESG